MSRTLPIKDIETINQIKKLYYQREKYRDLLLFLLSINTGANLLDLLGLNVGDVKDKYYLALKNKCSIPLNEETRKLIEIVIGERKSKEPLFVNNKGGRLDRTGAFQNFKSIRNELALGNEISVASFRKTFGYFHYMRNKDLSFLQWLFGQNTVNSTLKFIDIKENMGLRFGEGVCL